MVRYRFRAMGTSENYDRYYAAIDKGSANVDVVHMTWRRDGILVLPRKAKGQADELYSEFCSWLEERHPEEARRADALLSLRVPLEMPASTYQWH